MISLRLHRNVLFSPATFALLLATQAVLVHAQFYNPRLTFSPAQPISTEPFTITFISDAPEGSEYYVTVEFAQRPYGDAAHCQAIQKNGSAVCQIGRLAPNFYTVSAGGGGGNEVQPFKFNVLAPGASTVSALQGQYAFLVTSQSSGSATTPTGAAAAGSFTADGQGNITAGTMDLNGAGPSFQGLPVTGSYTLNTIGQGTLTFNTSQGAMSLAVVVPTKQTTSNVLNANLVALPGSLVTGGGTLVNQSGLLVSSVPVNPGFVPTLTGGYQGTLAGELGSAVVPIGGAMQFAFSAAGSVTSEGQLTVGGGPVSFNGLAGTYTPIDGTTGRTTFTLAAPGQPSFSFAAYETSEQSFYYLSLAPHASNPLFAGTATQ